MTAQVERAAFVPGRDRRLVRQSIPAGCRAGWRSEGFGRTRRRRGNSQTWPRWECRWRCGHGRRRRGTPSIGDLTQRAVARWDLSTSSSWCRKQGRVFSLSFLLLERRQQAPKSAIPSRKRHQRRNSLQLSLRHSHPMCRGSWGRRRLVVD